MSSLWEITADLPRFRALGGGMKTDVLIIGGGMAGILCAWHLQQAGIDYALVEEGRICRGISGSTTAKLTSQHGLIYSKIIREYGLEKAGLYLRANEEALEQFRQLCKNMDCDFAEKNSYVYSLTDSRCIEEELAALEQLDFPAEFAKELPLPFPVAGAVKFPRQAQFHPLKFVAALAPGLRIFENTKVLELLPGQAVTNRGRIFAEKIIVATHFPLLNKHGAYFLKQFQHRSYVIALENGPQLDGIYVDQDQYGLSFRNQNGRLIIGGGAHRTGKEGGGWLELERFARQHYPHSPQVCRWAAQDCMTLDEIPYIGPYSKRTEGLYVATGFNKWGMTSSMVAAKLLCDLVQGRDNDYAELFSPSRSMLHPQLFLNLGEATLNLLRPTVPRCPHMGCALRYNRQEHSWDCPCHGSRFAENGKKLDNPATDDKRF